MDKKPRTDEIELFLIVEPEFAQKLTDLAKANLRSRRSHIVHVLSEHVEREWRPAMAAPEKTRT